MTDVITHTQGQAEGSGSGGRLGALQEGREKCLLQEGALSALPAWGGEAGLSCSSLCASSRKAPVRLSQTPSLTHLAKREEHSQHCGTLAYQLIKTSLSRKNLVEPGLPEERTFFEAGRAGRAHSKMGSAAFLLIFPSIPPCLPCPMYSNTLCLPFFFFLIIIIIIILEAPCLAFGETEPGSFPKLWRQGQKARLGLLAENLPFPWMVSEYL